jgi:hypothetical protein
MDSNEKGVVGSDAPEKGTDGFSLGAPAATVKPVEDEDGIIKAFCGEDDGWTTLQPEPSERLRVEVLSDNQGVFGVGTVDERGFEKIYLITRPDRMVDCAGNAIADDGRCALQPIPRARFCKTVEANLVDILHRSMAEKHDLMEKHNGYAHWRRWSEASDPVRARQIYHGLKIKSLKIVNSVIRKALEVADRRALLAARRFPILHRARLYRAFCMYGERAIQLGDTFPLLAIVLFTDQFSLREAKNEEMRQAGISMILNGVRLNKIAAAMEIPYRLRHVKPGATRRVKIRLGAAAIGYLPKTTRKQKLFFLVLNVLEEKGVGFGRWAGEFIESMTAREELGELDEIADWLHASEIKNIPAEHFQIIDRFRELRLIPSFIDRETGTKGAELVTRPFSPDMSLKTVRRLTAEWHEAVANNMTEGKLIKFPEPWIKGAEINAHKIVPITDSRELYLASKALHNCANTYAQDILDSRCCLYSVTNGDSRPTVMVEIAHTDKGGVVLGQIKGYCNGPAPKEIERMVRRWFNRSKSSAWMELPECKENEAQPWDDEDMPF